MYIKYNGVNYPCECKPSRTMSYHGLPDNFPAPVSGEIVLCADDDFVLRTDVAEDYLRQTFDGGVLILTNDPEPVEPEPDTELSKLDIIEAQVTYTAMMTDTLLEV